MLNTETSQYKYAFAYHVLRYASNLIRDEWVNIGILLFDPRSGNLRLRMVESQDEYARIRRLHPAADEEAIRQLREHLEDRVDTFLRNNQAELDRPLSPGKAVQAVIDKWNSTLSNGIQLATQTGSYADDLDLEMERLYDLHVAPPHRESRVGAPGSRPRIRHYCDQVWQQAGLWEKIRKSVRVDEFTSPGDPMRIDYGYQRNGTRGFVQTLSVSRAPADCKNFAYTVDRIASSAAFGTEFTAVTDVPLLRDNARHQFVGNTLRGSGIEAVPLEGFAVWVGKLRPTLR